MKAFKYCDKMLTKKEAVALADCVKNLPWRPVIVQIGANQGRSTIAMLETRPDAFIFSIDLKPYANERLNILEAGLDINRVVRILGNSQKIDWPYDVDMVYFDGDHRYDGIKADCEKWLDKIKPNGFAVFHDFIVNNPPPKNQVAEVVLEFFPPADWQPFMEKERVIAFQFLPRKKLKDYQVEQIKMWNGENE